MKKLFIIILCLLFVTGCGEQEEVIVDDKVHEDVPSQEVEEEKIPEYVDYNTTPIGIYRLNGNKLTRLEKINTDLVVEKDIGVFQIYPSNQSEIILNSSFGQSFYNEWSKYSANSNLKIGFNIKFTLSNGQKIDYNIFDPSQTFDHWEHLMNYLYDDYANLGKKYYSHIENNEYTQSTLFTAFKIQSSYQCYEINSGIEFSVFTYDGDDDFVNNTYRGNSIYSMMICVNGKTCEKDTSD